MQQKLRSVLLISLLIPTQIGLRNASPKSLLIIYCLCTLMYYFLLQDYLLLLVVAYVGDRLLI